MQHNIQHINMIKQKSRTIKINIIWYFTQAIGLCNEPHSWGNVHTWNTRAIGYNTCTNVGVGMERTENQMEGWEKASHQANNLEVWMNVDGS